MANGKKTSGRRSSKYEAPKQRRITKQQIENATYKDVKLLELANGCTISPSDAIVTLSSIFKLAIVANVPAIDLFTPSCLEPYLPK